MESQHLPTRDPLGFLAKHFSGYEPFALSTGATVQVPKYSLTFSGWSGEPIPNPYNKPIIDYKGEPLCAELVVLRFMQEQGWHGVWVDTYGVKYRIGMPKVAAPVELPADKERLIASIRANAKTSGGCWDVFVWKGDQVMFLELKREKRDAIKDTQRVWIDAAIGEGVDPSSFALVEWRNV